MSPSTEARGRPLPSRRALGAAGLLLAFALVASVETQLLPAWQVLAVLIAAAAIADGLAARALPPRIEIARRLPRSLPIGQWRECALKISSRSRFAAACEVYDHHPAACEVEGLPQRVTVPALGFAQLQYRLRPLERGALRFGTVATRVASPLGLWEMAFALGGEQIVRCYPDFAELANYALFATENRLSQIGVLRRQRRGAGLEFHQLREFREGDALRQIDWKATSRHRRLISREYEDERDQHIVFLIDCGRRMIARDAPLAHFDEVLNAVLLLAFVALRQGDAAGLMTFGAETPRFVPPRKSRSTINLFLNTLYDLQPTLRPPDFHSAAIELSKRLTRRTLVVVLTNLRDEDEETLLPALALLKRRHLVLFANLREAALETLRDRRVQSLDDALTVAAGAIFERDRARALKRLTSLDAILLDTPPGELAISLVNRYLDLKRAGRL